MLASRKVKRFDGRMLLIFASTMPILLSVIAPVIYACLQTSISIKERIHVGAKTLVSRFTVHGSRILGTYLLRLENAGHIATSRDRAPLGERGEHLLC